MPHKSTAEHLRDFLALMAEEGLVESEWGKPDLRTAKKVLGLRYAPELRGDAGVIGRVAAFARDGLYSDDKQKVLNFICGAPGTGKTRMLYESAAKVMRETPNCGIVAVTFNGKQNANICALQERELLQFGSHIPVLMRIIHAYLGGVAEWGEFSSRTIPILKSLERVDRLIIKRVIDMIAERHGVDNVVLLVDDVLRWLTAPDLCSGAKPEEKVIVMVDNMCYASSMRGRAFIFSALAAPMFLALGGPPTGRPILPNVLEPLSQVHSKKLTDVVIEDHCGDLCAFSGLSSSEVIRVLDALAVGGLAGAEECLHDEIRDLYNRRGFGIMTIVAGVHRRLMDKYSTDWRLIAFAVAGVQTWPKAKCLITTSADMPNNAKNAQQNDLMKFTALELANRGHLPLSSDSMRVEIRFSPALLLSSLMYVDHAVTVEYREAAYYLASVWQMTPLNVWREYVIRVLILRSHLPLSSELVSGDNVVLVSYLTGMAVAVKHNGIELPLNAPAFRATSRDFTARRLASLLNLFVFKNSKALINGCMPDTAVVMAWPFSNTVVTFAKEKPPTPGDLIAIPMLMRHVYAFESEQEPGVDSLIFIRRADGDITNPQDLIAVGIQCDKGSSKLTAATVETARSNFHTTMCAREWSDTQLIFVVLANCELSNKTEFMSQVGDNVIVLDKDEIAHWLGPSLVDMLQNMHNAASVSRSPRTSLAQMTATFTA